MRNNHDSNINRSGLIVSAGFFLAIALFLLISCQAGLKEVHYLDTLPEIFPDYTGVIIPSNIAPLNFYMNDGAKKYRIKIYSMNGKAINLAQRSPKIKIPVKKWQKLMAQNSGNDFNIDIYAWENGWKQYKTITKLIANEPVDSYLAYRLINPVYIFWREMGIYQRDLQTFRETPIFENSSTDYGCVNCHAFSNNDPQKMSLHFREVFAGTMISHEQTIRKATTKTPYTMSNAVYPSWHPNGELVAYSVNRINQDFASNKKRLDIVSDQASDIIIYNVKTNQITTSPKISTASRENLPKWSPDGKWLYYISAPAQDEAPGGRLFAKYSLLRIPYSADTNEWGHVDTVLSANTTGKSITHPKVSPDGRFVVFAMVDLGYFSIYDQGSNLYILDLETREYKPMNINSDFTESYHSWSRNGHWMVFSSKRLDGVYTRPFYAYVHENGETEKPFVLPQKDPLFYKTFLKNYNIPELITGKVPLNSRKTRNIAYTSPVHVEFDKTIDIQALSGATRFDYNNAH